MINEDSNILKKTSLKTKTKTKATSKNVMPVINSIKARKIKDLIVENFLLLSQVNKGAFGDIYLSYDFRSSSEVAIKKEKRQQGKTPQLSNEAKVYQTLLNIKSNDITGKDLFSQERIVGFPKFYGMGALDDSYYLIIEFLGPNLLSLLTYCNYPKYTIGTVCLIALQMLYRIEYFHKRYYLHRDIKPENFVIGIEERSNIVYLVDYGLSKRFKNPKNHQHIPYKENRALVGTARYISINTHLGKEQSRRDDLESIGYVLIFFLKGGLPWQGLKTETDRYRRIMEKKLQFPTEVLCHGLPLQLTYYMNYVKSLRFEDRPDYDYLRTLFVDLLNNCANMYSLTIDLIKYDWCFKEPKKSIWHAYKKTTMKGNSNAGGGCTGTEVNERDEKNRLQRAETSPNKILGFFNSNKSNESLLNHSFNNSNNYLQLNQPSNVAIEEEIDSIEEEENHKIAKDTLSLSNDDDDDQSEETVKEDFKGFTKESNQGMIEEEDCRDNDGDGDDAEDIDRYLMKKIGQRVNSLNSNNEFNETSKYNTNTNSNTLSEQDRQMVISQKRYLTMQGIQENNLKDL